MKSFMLIQSISALTVTCLLYSHAFGDLDPPEMYDDFNAKSFRGVKRVIDTSKWSGKDQGTHVGEIERKIKAKRAYLKIRTWGNDTEDTGYTTGRNRLIFKNEIGTISGVCFTPRVKKYANNKCSANTQLSSGEIKYWGSMYDSNTQEDNEDGKIYTEIKFGRSTFQDESGVKKSRFLVFGRAWQCVGENCDAYGWTTSNTGETDPNLKFGEFKRSNRTELCVGYDAAAHELVFSAGDDVRIVDAATNGLPPKVADVHPNRIWHTIDARVDVANCHTEGMLPGYLEGDIDNVKVRRKP